MGPMTAARRFLDELIGADWPRPAGAEVERLGVSLHGSLAYTGAGHGTGRAVILGLVGELPQTIDPDRADAIAAQVALERRVSPPGHPSYRFDPAVDLVFDRKHPLPGHANGMAFQAYDPRGGLLLRRVYYSIGGGFVVSDEKPQLMKSGSSVTEAEEVPYPFTNATDMLAMASENGLSIAEMTRANEETRRAREDLDAGLDAVWEAMRGCIERGLAHEGVMPGGLKVRRRPQGAPAGSAPA